MGNFKVEHLNPQQRKAAFDEVMKSHTIFVARLQTMKVIIGSLSKPSM
jgi:hypothetical protein